MLLPLSVHRTATAHLAPIPNPHPRLSPPKPSSSSPQLLHLTTKKLPLRLAAAAAADALQAEALHDDEDGEAGGEGEDDSDEEEAAEFKVEVPEVEDPMLVLKFIWMEKNIGIALDQLVPGYGSIPLSPYYFWPRKDAWEELRAKLEEKEWISQKQMIILLNQATDIINLWQQGGGGLSSST